MASDAPVADLAAARREAEEASAEWTDEVREAADVLRKKLVEHDECRVCNSWPPAQVHSAALAEAARSLLAALASRGGRK